MNKKEQHRPWRKPPRAGSKRWVEMIGQNKTAAQDRRSVLKENRRSGLKRQRTLNREAGERQRQSAELRRAAVAAAAGNTSSLGAALLGGQ